jgi:hypothetical protein
MLTFV